MSRPDQSITFLKSFGYSVFRVPKANASPLLLLHRNGKDLTRLGAIGELIVAGPVPPPAVQRDDHPGIDIDGSETSSINVSIGVSILGAFIGALGGSNLGIQAGFKNARTVKFQYTGVLEDSIDVLALEHYVRAGSINPNTPSGTIDKLIDDEVYVVTSVLKSSKLGVTAQAESGTNVQLDVPIIQQAIGGNVKVESSGALSSTIRFEGKLPIAFAFQAAQLMFDESGQFLTTQALPAGDAAARALPSSAAGVGMATFLTAPGAFVRLAE